MSHGTTILARLVLPVAVGGALFAGPSLGQDEGLVPGTLSNEDAGPAFSPEIWAAPDPSRLVVRGRCLPGEDLYRLVVEYETDGSARYRALAVFAEPSHRLLFVQWNGVPRPEERAALEERLAHAEGGGEEPARWSRTRGGPAHGSAGARGPLAVFEQDSQRRHATFRFRPEGDDRILVQVLTAWNEWRDALEGRVGDLCDFTVENRVHD
ncbi:MAG TPA: hypothetical protein VMS86_06250 [Thermoanaerobaculia bacterium]|nr:hypothetical protein [Thermoanaerobaculia bacterium]